MSEETINDAPARCARCEAELAGRWCHACGEDSRPPARRLADIWEDLLDNVFAFSAAVPRTLKALFTRPSLVPRALRAGDRTAFLSPMKLYVSASLVFFIFVGLANVPIVQWKAERTSEAPPRIVVGEDGATFRPENFRMVDLWLHPAQPGQANAEILRAFDEAIPKISDVEVRAIQSGMRDIAADPSALDDAIATWWPRALWLLMPIYALLLWPMYARGTLVSHHVIFALWAHTMLFLLLMLGALWNMTGLGAGLGIALLAYQVYFTLGLKGYYEQSWAGAVVKGLVHSFVYIGLIWLPLGIGFLLFYQAFPHLPPGHFTE